MIRFVGMSAMGTNNSTSQGKGTEKKVKFPLAEESKDETVSQKPRKIIQNKLSSKEDPNVQHCAQPDLLAK